LDWPTLQSTRDARTFIGLVVYYRIFIPDFAIIAPPIFSLFRKAMDILKNRTTTAPVLITLDFSASALSIIGWGTVLSQQQEDGRLHPARYESGIWSDVERKYDAFKLECRRLLNSLKKFRFWLFGRYFPCKLTRRRLYGF
jgi:hypothetical protein